MQVCRCASEQVVCRCTDAGVHKCRGREVQQKCRCAEVQSLRVAEVRGAGVQGWRGAWVERCRGAEVQSKVQEKCRNTEVH